MEKDKLNRLEDKIDKVNEKLQEISITLSENTHSLIIHEKRTDIAEKKLELLETEFKEKNARDSVVLNEIEKKLEPVHTHVNLINVIFKYVIPAIAASILFLVKIEVIKF
jgi:hypothetical protein